MQEQLVETWAIHNRIHLYLLEAIPDEALGAGFSSLGRNVFDLFAHMHNVRLMWLKAAAPELLDGLDKLEPKSAGSKQQLTDSLSASGKAVEALLRTSIADGGRVKGFNPHATAFRGYLISHESHHRGEIGLTLKHNGYPLDRRPTTESGSGARDRKARMRSYRYRTRQGANLAPCSVSGAGRNSTVPRLKYARTIQMGRGREAWILGALVLVFVVATVYYGKQSFEEQRREQPTTYSIDPGGLKVFYQLLERQGVPVRRFERPLTRLPAEAGVLVMAEPMQRKVEPDEVDALWDWVADGGTLLFIVGSGARNLGGDSIPLKDLQVLIQQKKAIPADLPPSKSASDSPFLRDVQRMHVDGATRLASQDKTNKTLLADSLGAYAVTWRYEDGGSVIVATDGVMPSNGRIDAADNAVFFVNVAQQHAKDRALVLFDEYHQGFVAEGGGRSLWEAIGAPARAAFWYLLVVFLLVVYNANRRFGSALRIEPPSSRPSTEYIEGMAGLFRRARAPELALELIYQAFRHDLAARIDAAPDSPPESIAAASARRFGWNIESVRTLMTRCEEIVAGDKMTDAELMRLAAEIQDYRRKAALVRI